MGRPKILGDRTVNFIQSRLDSGLSRSAIVKEARQSGLGITERDVQKVRFGGLSPEIHAVENKVARGVGYDTVEDREADRKKLNYRTQWLGAQDVGMTQEEFERRRNDIFKTEKQNDVSPNGDLAKYLIDIGLRDADATYNVGETPKRKK